jgi:hypothetical protein
MTFLSRLLVLVFLVALGVGCDSKGGPTSGGVPPLPASNAGNAGAKGSYVPPPSPP